MTPLPKVFPIWMKSPRKIVHNRCFTIPYFEGEAWSVPCFSAIISSFLTRLISVFFLSFQKSSTVLQCSIIPDFVEKCLWTIIHWFLYIFSDFRRLFYHHPSFLNHSIHSVLLGRTGVSCQFVLFHPSVPCPSILFRRRVLGYFGKTFQSSIIPYFEEGRLCLFSLTCIHSSLRGLVSIYLFKGLFCHPCLLIHSKPVRKNYSTIFSLLSEVADLFLIISWKFIFHCHQYPLQHPLWG